jgi:hypothetical protein
MTRRMRAVAGVPENRRGRRTSGALSPIARPQVSRERMTKPVYGALLPVHDNHRLQILTAPHSPLSGRARRRHLHVLQARFDRATAGWACGPPSGSAEPAARGGGTLGDSPGPQPRSTTGCSRQPASISAAEVDRREPKARRHGLPRRFARAARGGEACAVAPAAAQRPSSSPR